MIYVDIEQDYDEVFLRGVYTGPADLTEQKLYDLLCYEYPVEGRQALNVAWKGPRSQIKRDALAAFAEKMKRDGVDIPVKFDFQDLFLAWAQLKGYLTPVEFSAITLPDK